MGVSSQNGTLLKNKKEGKTDSHSNLEESQKPYVEREKSDPECMLHDSICVTFQKRPNDSDREQSCGFQGMEGGTREDFGGNEMLIILMGDG